MVSFAKLLKTPQQTSFVETLCKNLKKPIIFYGKPGGIENSGGLRKRAWSVVIHMRIVDQLSWRWHRKAQNPPCFWLHLLDWTKDRSTFSRNIIAQWSDHYVCKSDHYVCKFDIMCASLTLCVQDWHYVCKSDHYVCKFDIMCASLTLCVQVWSLCVQVWHHVCKFDIMCASLIIMCASPIIMCASLTLCVQVWHYVCKFDIMCASLTLCVQVWSLCVQVWSLDVHVWSLSVQVMKLQNGISNATKSSLNKVMALSNAITLCWN